LPSRYPELDLSAVRTVPIAERESKLRVEDILFPSGDWSLYSRTIDELPRLGYGATLRSLIDSLAELRRKNLPIIIGMGAHSIKCGLSPWFIFLMKEGHLSHLSANGAMAIHDLELAFFGATSEDVAENLPAGTFGLAEETGRLINELAGMAQKEKLGLGEAFGRSALQKAPHAEISLLAQAYRWKIPVTIHVAIGTDIVCEHPTCDGSAWGESSLRDFRILCASLEKFKDGGGAYINIGSAVIMPEVFLKALAVVINLHGRLPGLVTANLDQIQHYRPGENVIRRPGGKSFTLTGHHEIMVPLVIGGLLHQLTKGN